MTPDQDMTNGDQSDEAASASERTTLDPKVAAVQEDVRRERAEADDVAQTTPEAG